MKYFILCILSITIYSCSNDDDTSSNEPGLDGLNGTWNLVQVSGGFTGIEQIFDKGLIVWDFDESSKMVTVTNNAVNTNGDTFFPSGVYSYNVSAPADIEKLFIEDVSYGTFIFENSYFTVDQRFVDGSLFRFER